MTNALPFPVARARARKLFLTTCAAAIVAAAMAAQPALAQSPAAMDASKLPRPASARILAALPESTIYQTSDSVAEAAQASLKLLEANGWQRFTNARSQPANTPTSETHYLKRGQQGLTLFVQAPPAPGNATSVSYIPMPIARDLPFPAGGSDIRFAWEPFHLDATAALSRDGMLAFYRTELTKAGWVIHSASDGSAARQITSEPGTHLAFLTHPGMGALHLVVRAAPVGSSVAIRTIPAAVLPGAQVAKAPEPTPPPAAVPNPQAEAHAQMSQSMNAMAQDLMKQAMQQPPKSQGIEAAMAAARAAGVKIDMPGKAPATSAAPAPAAEEPPLERDIIGGLPIPKSASQKSQEKTSWRLEVNAVVRASTTNVLGFYRRELGALGWREASTPQNEGDRTILTYTSDEGPATLTIERKGKDTSATLLLRKEAEARKAGMLPKAGQARLMFGSMMDGEATVLVGGKTLKVASGVGSKNPDGPSLEVAPGAHKVTIKSAGKPDVVETVTVKANDIWGVLLGPGGALPLPFL